MESGGMIRQVKKRSLARVVVAIHMATQTAVPVNWDFFFLKKYKWSWHYFMPLLIKVRTIATVRFSASSRCFVVYSQELCVLASLRLDLIYIVFFLSFFLRFLQFRRGLDRNTAMNTAMNSSRAAEIFIDLHYFQSQTTKTERIWPLVHHIYCVAACTYVLE